MITNQILVLHHERTSHIAKDKVQLNGIRENDSKSVAKTEVDFLIPPMLQVCHRFWAKFKKRFW